jgi:hemerythrin
MYNTNLLGINPPAINEIINFPGKWWINHIINVDRKYEDYKKEIQSDVTY